jgi:hypothetical protein
LAFGGDDVGVVRPGRGQHGERRGLDDRDEQCTRRVRGLGELGHRLELPEEVRLCRHETRDVIAERGRCLGGIGAAGGAGGDIDRDGDDLDARPRTVRLEHATVVGVHGR